MKQHFKIFLNRTWCENTTKSLLLPRLTESSAKTPQNPYCCQDWPYCCQDQLSKNSTESLLLPRLTQQKHHGIPTAALTDSAKAPWNPYCCLGWLSKNTMESLLLPRLTQSSAKTPRNPYCCLGWLSKTPWTLYCCLDWLTESSAKAPWNPYCCLDWLTDSIFSENTMESLLLPRMTQQKHHGIPTAA